MYWTPAARLMKSITPNRSVRPAAIRKSRTPNWSPFRTWTTKRPVDIAPVGRLLLFHRTVFGVRIGEVRENLFVDFGLELAIGAFGNFDQIEVLDRIVVGVELEAAAQRREIRLFQGRP